MSESLNKFDIYKELGNGAFSEVKIGKHKDSGDWAAIKIMKNGAVSSADTLMKLVQNEINAMKMLTHDNLVRLYDSGESDYTNDRGVTEKVFYMALELCSGGELFDFIAQTGKFSEPLARYYFKQMIDGLEYMHNQGISHRDMKPENVLLDKDYVLKIADFGFASAKSVNETRRGTESYMAPEIHLKQPYSGQSVDLFAAAIILFIMITQHPPFAKAVPTDPHYKLVCANRLDLFWKFHARSKAGGLDFFSEDFIGLISSMLQQDPTHRPSLAEIKSHPWFNGETASTDEVREEFSRRKAMLDGFADNSNPEPQVDVDPNVFTQNQAHRGEKGEEESKMPVLERTCKPFIPGFGKVTQFFSTSKVDQLFNTVASFAE